MNNLFCVLLLLFPIFSVANNNEKRLRFFNLDLHVSVIADIKNIFESLGHEVVDWSISSSTWVFGRNPDHVDIVNESSWHELNQEMCDRFYERYKDFLEQFDAFIVTYNSTFALLYEKTNKPIIIINPARYEHPFTLYPEKWKWINEYLKKGVSDGKIFIVSNNKGDQGYLKFYTGLDSEHIPSLCQYTNALYGGIKKGFICKAPCWKMFRSYMQDDLIQNEFLKEPHDWQELYDYQGIIHVPYQISTMSIFEQYSANVPLFFPTKRLLKYLYFNHPIAGALSQLSYFPVMGGKCPQVLGDLNNISDEHVIDFWINSADFYDEQNMPYLIYYDTFYELKTHLETLDLQDISNKMKQHNKYRKQCIIQKWKYILEKLK